jgi:transcriptional regulator with XRE-family HTH domain
MTDTIRRRSGVRLDPAKLDHELGRRGLTARRLAELSGIPEPTLSRARHGRPITERHLRALADALLTIPVLAGVDLLISAPTNGTADNATVEQTNRRDETQ